MKKSFKTERLFMRQLTEDDAEFILKLMNSPSWLKYIGDRNVHTIEAAKKYLRDGSIKSYVEKGFGFYLCTLKSDAKPIGVCGLIKRDTLEDVDIGFAFMADYEGCGYGYESASAVMGFVENELELDRLVAITSPDNQRSIVLLKKIGLTYEKRIDWEESDEELLLFSIDFNM